MRAAEIWRIAYFDAGIRAKVANELLASRPIPARRDGELGFWFFYHASFGPPPAPVKQLYPPSWRVFIAADDGGVAQLEIVKPDDLGLPVPERQPFATHAWPSSWTLDEANRKREELLAAYDAAVPAWEAWERAGGPAPGQDADDFRARFLELVEPPYLPCYRALGPSFFRWAGV